VSKLDGVEVLVLGAGIAGLAAAGALAERGVRVLVIEARDRVGGRIFTERTANGAFVEHGAEFIHGRASDLWALIKEAGAEAVERGGSVLREEKPGDGLASEADEEDDFFGPLEGLADLPGEDMPFAEWLAGSDVPEGQRGMLTGYVEGFNAADAKKISARSLGIQQRAEDANEGDRSWHLPGGYTQLTEHLAARVRELGGEIRLGCTVNAVRWRPGEVVVSTQDGGQREDLHAPKCVVTLPLGVLQAANSSAPYSVRIEPEPTALFEARRLAMGQVVRFTLVFRERWWEGALDSGAHPESLRTMSFLFTSRRMPPVWWTRHPEPEPLPTLVGWAGGPRSEALRGKGPSELGEFACRELSETLRVPPERIRGALISVHGFDWSADPFALGAYSYVPAGALDAPGAMSVPEHGTLFFAGEHTDTTGNWGTVHAALSTGLRAARQILGEE
jgi:monoamine oxidase